MTKTTLQSCASMFENRGDPWSQATKDTPAPVPRTAYGRKADEIKIKHKLTPNAYPKEGRVSLQGKPDPDMDRWTEAGFKKQESLFAGVGVSTTKPEPIKQADLQRKKRLLQHRMRQQAKGDL